MAGRRADGEVVMGLEAPLSSFTSDAQRSGNVSRGAEPGPSDAGDASVAVVMLTFNGGTKTLEALQSLVASEEPADVLLWDNGSSDGTAASAARRFPQVLVHRHPTNLGVASGRNAAAALALERFRPTHLLFLDDDMNVRPGFVRALLEPFLSDPAVGQSQAKLLFQHDPRILNDGGGCDVRFWAGTTFPVGYGEPDLGQFDVPRECVSCGGAMMVRTDVFQRLGGFDTTFNPFGPEDLDFSLRLQRAGYRAIYWPSAVALHAGSGTFEGGKRSAQYTQKRIAHWIRFLRRHASPAQQASFFLVGGPYRAVRMLGRALRSGNPAVLRGMLASVRELTGARRSGAAGPE
jgi:GT2 family glycosyltransferase